jgi:3-oxoacyl-[acyl-carrier protein] reductase
MGMHALTHPETNPTIHDHSLKELHMDYGLRDKVAIVTGGANGIGASICATLAAEGARVIVADVNGELAQAKADEIVANGSQAIAVSVDVIDEHAVNALFKAAVARWGTVDILVNNAGFTRDMRITEMSTSDWDAVVDVVLKGAFLCTRKAIPLMTERGGRIINISSRAHLGNPGQANYSAAKAGIIGFTKAMALENGRHGITVNAIAPGIIGTDAVLNLPHFPKIKEAAERTTPVPRIGVPEDVAHAVAFLASAHTGYITGDVLHVTGGRY